MEVEVVKGKWCLLELGVNYYYVQLLQLLKPGVNGLMFQSYLSLGQHLLPSLILDWTDSK